MSTRPIRPLAPRILPMASLPRHGCSPTLNRDQRHSRDLNPDPRRSNIDRRIRAVLSRDQRRSLAQNHDQRRSPGQFLKPDRNLDPLRNIKTPDLRRSVSRTIEGQTDDAQQVVSVISGTTGMGRLRRLRCIFLFDGGELGVQIERQPAYAPLQPQRPGPAALPLDRSIRFATSSPLLCAIHTLGTQFTLAIARLSGRFTQN